MTKESSSSFSSPIPSIILFGPPGSGKGTLGKTLSTITNHLHLSSGDIFRNLAKDSPEGKLFDHYANQGLLLPDKETVAIWRSYLTKKIENRSYSPEKQFLILDGIPRTLTQLTYMKPDIDIRYIILLKISNKDALIQRLKKRAAIEGRYDDTSEEILRTRMDIYEKETTQLIKISPKEKIITLDAEQSPLEILRDLLKEIATPLGKSFSPENHLTST